MWIIILKFLSVFICTTCADIFWGLYIKNVSDKNKKVAANYCTLLGVCYLISLHILIYEWWYGLAYLAGCWVGTYYHQWAEDLAKTIVTYFKRSS